MHKDVATAVDDRRNPFSSLRDRLFGSRSGDALGPKGEQKVGKELGKLPTGWRVLHRLQVTDHGDGAGIDHIVIGPPGVITLHTKHHPKGKVKVYERTLYVDGATKNYVWMSEREARHAGTALTDVCGFKVPTQSAVVFVDVADIQHKGRPFGVTITTRQQLIDWLTALPAHMHPRQVEHIWTEARRPEVWLPA